MTNPGKKRSWVGWIEADRFPVFRWSEDGDVELVRFADGIFKRKDKSGKVREMKVRITVEAITQEKKK